MAETEKSLKRPREETRVEEEEIEETRRQRLYQYILSILEDEEEEPHQHDLSSLMTTLQQEISSEPRPFSSDPQPDSSFHPLLPQTKATIEPTTTTATTGNNDHSSSLSTSSSPLLFKDYDKKEEEQKGSTVIRHLLEASDDELGIPQTQIRLQTEDEVYDFIHGGVQFGGSNNGEGETTISLFDVHDGLWDFEDFETTHYYTHSQSELFM